MGELGTSCAPFLVMHAHGVKAPRAPPPHAHTHKERTRSPWFGRWPPPFFPSYQSRGPVRRRTELCLHFTLLNWIRDRISSRRWRPTEGARRVWPPRRDYLRRLPQTWLTLTLHLIAASRWKVWDNSPPGDRS